MTQAWGIVVATGKEQELASGVETAFLGIGSRPALAHVLEAYESCRDIEGVVVVASRERVEMVAALAQRFGINKVRNVVSGAPIRRTSVELALRAMDDEVEYVVIQDVCRPFVNSAMVSAVVAAARKHGCAITGEPLAEPVKQVSKHGVVEAACPEGELWLAQSPQAFRLKLLEKALAAASKKKAVAMEESAFMSLIHAEVRVVRAGRRNHCLRDADDLAIASQFLP